MPDPTAISDEELTAYLDGEADAAVLARIEDDLSAGGELEARLDALRFDQDALTREADRLFAEAPPFPMRPANQTQAPRGLALAASLVLGLALGAGGLSLWSPEPKLDDWRDYAAAYHALYVPETVAPLNSKDSERAAQLDRVSAAVGLSLSDTRGDHGLTLRRAQVLGYQDSPIAHLAFSADDGTPVAYCVTKATGPASDPEYKARQGIATMEWSDGQHQFILIGHIPEPEMARMAAAFATKA